MTTGIGEDLRLLKAQISPDHTYAIAQELSCYHRVQASSGYRAAANRAADLMKEAGVACTVKSYPAHTGSHCFTHSLFQEWHCESATLELTFPAPRLLADFSVNDMSVIQRSGCCKVQDVPVVWLPDGFTPDTPTPPVCNRVIFIENGFAALTDWAIAQGALGILTVSMPQMLPVRTEMPNDPELRDCCANLSFHWLTPGQEGALFGFALTPRQGRELALLCETLAATGEAPRIRAEVHSRFYSGNIENVQADISGACDEEILITAHLCHPKSSVNDNLSGTAAAMEAMIALQQLIDQGKLSPPRRRIRLLLVPEFTGTYAYLAENEARLDSIPAGINLDMVGAWQHMGAGPMLVLATPYASCSFMEDLSAAVLEELQKESPLADRGEHVALFSAAIKPFMVGSDHYILSDPTIGIPAVAVTQWPDKAYHTSMDQIDRLDPAMLARVAVFTAVYVYTLATLSPQTAQALLDRTTDRALLQITRLARGGQAEDFAPCCIDYLHNTMGSYLRYFPENPHFASQVAQRQRYISDFAALTFGFVPAVGFPVAPHAPRRLFRAPLSTRSMVAALSPGELARWQALCKRYSSCTGVMDYILYAVNGSDSPEVIAKRVEYETGVSCLDYTRELIEFLLDNGLAELQSDVKITKTTGVCDDG